MLRSSFRVYLNLQVTVLELFWIAPNRKDNALKAIFDRILINFRVTLSELYLTLLNV